MRAPEAEIHQQLAGGGQDAPRGLAGDQGLEMQQVDDAALHQLGLRHGRGHPQDGFIGEKRGALRHGVHVAGETQVLQTIQEFVCEEPTAPGPVDIRCGEMQGLQVLQHLLQAGCQQESPPGGQLAGKELEGRGIGHAVHGVPLQHGELVEVGEQRAGRPVHACARSRLSGAAPRRSISASARSPSPGSMSTARMASRSRYTRNPSFSASLTVNSTQ